NGDTTTVTRGCIEHAQDADVIYDQCDTDLCNTANVVRCVRCPSSVTAECVNVICPTSDDQCYVNPTDGKRGCTTDPEYSDACSDGNGGSSCTECSSESGQTCNDVLKCIVCNASENPDCILNSLNVQRCPTATDQCYRYVDAQQALHLGCTSEEDYTVNCEEGGNCRTCSSDACNRDVENLLGFKVECNIPEKNQCYTSYDWSTKKTSRGCFSDGLSKGDSFDLCDGDSCNDQSFPNHLQCYQCEDCDSVTEQNVNYCRNVEATGCFMLLVEFETGTKTLIRGCNTDAVFAECKINRNCETCEGDRCNQAPQILFQVCDQCEGVEECETQNEPSSCENTAFTNQCYLYSDGAAEELKKGCLLDLDETMAEACYDQTDTRCTICKENRCNRQHCVRCNTRTDGAACLLGDKNLPGLQYALCAGNCRMEIDAEGHTVRGCAENFEQPCVQGTCLETVPFGSNDGIFPANRRECYQCEGESCWSEQQPDNGKYCQLYRGSDDGCYIFNDGRTIVRGCTTDPEAKCTATDGSGCTVWLESLQNGAAQEQTPMTCYQNCPNGDMCPPVACAASTDLCYVSVSNSGVLSHGCTATECPPEYRDCYKCKDPNCNGVYSVCSTCDTSIDGDCTVGKEHGDICDQTVGCFQYQNDGRAIFGCYERAPAICLDDPDHCIFCSEAMCNAKALITCFSCTDCRDTVSPTFQKTKLCSTEEDTCITGLIDGRIDRDCLSDLPHPIDDYTIIESCSVQNCNQLKVTSCYVCTNCYDVSGGIETMLCLNPSTTQCYTKRDDNGVIVRGCATEQGIVGCVDGSNCKVCSGENCNDDAVPREFSCVQCDVSDDCANYNLVSECRNTLGVLFDSCVTYTNEDIVLKGCLSTSQLRVLCYGTSNDRCMVSQESMGNAKPVQCIGCSESAECVRGDPNELVTNSYLQGACVSFIDENGMIVRGNIVSYPNYRDSPDYQECYEDGCNGGLFPADRLLCYQCIGEECARLPQSTTTITPQPCLRYDTANAKCYTWYASTSNAQRGCLLDDDTLCSGEEISCETCAESRCNEHDYASFDKTKVCVQCTTNRACEQDPSEEVCNDSGGCYTFFSGLLVVAKGCVSELSESMEWYNECADGRESDRCERCYGDNCNRNKCYTCSSAFGTASNCIEPQVGLTESTACATNQGCVAFINADGHTIRGCKESFADPIPECTEQSGTCQPCKGDHCNGAVLPKERIKCYHCAGTPDCLEPARNSASYCDVYLEGEESCYTYFQDDRTVERGCTSQRLERCEEPCQTCNTTACNDQRASVPNRLSCAQCSGDECPTIGATVLADVKPCTEEILFGRTDQCYTYFHPEDGSIQRGCLSDVTKSESMIASKCLDSMDGSCKLCSGDGCNARSVSCFVCNTDSNPECADSLEETIHKAYLQACGTGQCVSLLNGSTTWKGCAEDFNKVDCKVEERCQIFDGSMSNSAIYPADRIRCYQCEGGGCDEIKSTARFSTCQQYNSTDECYTYVSDTGETFRGCLSDTLAAVQQCVEQPDVCITCGSESGCNNEPAKRSNELFCAQCFSAAECEQVVRFERCTEPLLLGRYDSCYVQSFAGEVLARGCLSDAVGSLRDKCTSGSSNECSVCQCDRCNGLPVECVSCEDEFDCGDVLGIDRATLVPCRTGSCVSFVKQLPSGASIIAKGCSEVYEADVCNKGQPNDATHLLCHSAGCNNVLFPVDRLKCFQCKEGACSDPALTPTICEPYSVDDSCYSFLDRQQKGCVRQLEDSTECNAGDDGRCVLCNVDGCNSEPRALECVVCSSKIEASCVEPMAMVQSRKLCPVGGCVTFIDDDGYTVRGCALDYQLTTALCTGTTCQVCTNNDACNNALFPLNRLQCYQCSGATCLDVTSQIPSFCQRYSANDTCYVYASSPTNIRRGCLSDPFSDCPADGCVKCSTANGCNSDPPIGANTLTCHQCEGVDCAIEQTGAGTVCPPVLLGRSDACYTWVEKYSVRRGCLSEERACSPMNPNCHICSSGKDCNADPYPIERHECVQCDELEEDERCRWGFNQSEVETCPSTQQSTYEVGCYSCYISSVDPTKRSLFHRGCVGEERQAQCEPATVQVCLGAGCNHRNERLQICAKCDLDDCEDNRWAIEECRGIVPYDRRGCYLMRDARKRVYSRGCVADLNDDTWRVCSNVRDSSCITCHGNECNHAIVALGSVFLRWTLVIAVLLGLCAH
uniref:DUF753 domain-containing protein n=1 Tax=Anopheles christyi TaxID=43041 RepID=A0A182JRT2_9DIPT